VIEAQRAVAAHEWPERQRVRVRMGLPVPGRRGRPRVSLSAAADGAPRPQPLDPANGVWGIGSAGAPVSYAAIARSAAVVRADPKTSQITVALRLQHIPCCPSGSVGNGVAVGHGRLWVGLESP
jgi:hypothetical protein